jgi:hypothetical protein
MHVGSKIHKTITIRYPPPCVPLRRGISYYKAHLFLQLKEDQNKGPLREESQQTREWSEKKHSLFEVRTALAVGQVSNAFV